MQKFKNILLWTFGITYGIFGLIFLFSGGFLTGLFFILISLLLIPKTIKYIENQFNLKLGFKKKVWAFIVFFIGTIIFMPEPENLENNDIKNTKQEVINKGKESEIILSNKSKKNNNLNTLAKIENDNLSLIDTNIEEKSKQLLNKEKEQIQEIVETSKEIETKEQEINKKIKEEEKTNISPIIQANLINEEKVGNKEKNIQNLKKIIVTKVSDGDTIHFKKDGKYYVARLIGIDSPENTETRYGHTERLGNEAKDYLNNLILNKEIQIEYDSSQARTDKYGRHLVYIFYKGENINKKMIEQGLAKEYTYNKPYKYQKEFLNAQSIAKSKKKGIWGLKQEVQKKVINQIQDHNEQPKKVCNIKGNINSKGEKIYHYPGCKSYSRTKISPSKGERYFCSEEEARRAGWRVAGNCR